MSKNHRGTPTGTNHTPRTSAERMGSVPPPPPKAKKNYGSPPPPGSKQYPTQEDMNNKNLKNKAFFLRRRGDDFRTSGGHRSSDTMYRQADEIESRMASGSQQLDDKAMSTIRPSAHLRDKPGSGWGTRLGDN